MTTRAPDQVIEQRREGVIIVPQQAANLLERDPMISQFPPVEVTAL
jgi:hypothetical protein